MTSSPSPDPARIEVGSLWGGGGMTVRVLELWEDDVKVLRLTGRGILLKRPRATGVIPRKCFADGTMRPTTIPPALAGGSR